MAICSLWKSDLLCFSYLLQFRSFHHAFPLFKPKTKKRITLHRSSCSLMELLTSLLKKKNQSDSLSCSSLPKEWRKFIRSSKRANCSFALKKRAIRIKTKEQVPNPGWYWTVEEIENCFPNHKTPPTSWVPCFSSILFHCMKLETEVFVEQRKQRLGKNGNEPMWGVSEKQSKRFVESGSSKNLPKLKEKTIFCLL